MRISRSDAFSFVLILSLSKDEDVAL